MCASAGIHVEASQLCHGTEPRPLLPQPCVLKILSSPCAQKPTEQGGQDGEHQVHLALGITQYTQFLPGDIGTHTLAGRAWPLSDLLATRYTVSWDLEAPRGVSSDHDWPNRENRNLGSGGCPGKGQLPVPCMHSSSRSPGVTDTPERAAKQTQ